MTAKPNSAQRRRLNLCMDADLTKWAKAEGRKRGGGTGAFIRACIREAMQDSRLCGVALRRMGGRI